MITRENNHTKKINWKDLYEDLKDKDLPCTREVLSLLETLDPDDEVSFQELASYILRDYGLTKKVIQLANSCLYNPSGVEIVTVSRALVFLGLKTVKEIVLASSYLEELVKNISQANRAFVLRLLSQSFLVAFFGNKIASKLNMASEELFVQFLFHRLMRLLLALHFPKIYKRIEDIERKNASLIKGRLYWLGTRLSREWSLPSSLKETFEGSPKAKNPDHPGYFIEKISILAEFLLNQKDPSQIFATLEKDLNLKLSEDDIKNNFKEALKTSIELYRPFENYLTLDEHEILEEQDIDSTVEFSKEELFQQALAEITSYLAEQGDYQKIIFMVLETIKRVLETEATLFGVYKPKDEKIILRFGVGKIKNQLKNKSLPVGDFLNKIFTKKIEWTSRIEAVPEFLGMEDFKGRDVLFSPIFVREKPLGVILTFRKKPFSNEEKRKINILRNIVSLAIDKSLSQN